MATTNWSTLRQEIARRSGGYVSFTTTTNIGAGTSVISTELQSRYPNDTRFIGWYVMPEASAAANDGVVRRVTAYTASTGTLTTTGPNWSSESAARAVGLYKRHPEDIRLAYNQVRFVLFPSIGSVVENLTVVTGQVGSRYQVGSNIPRRPLSVQIGRRPPAASIVENLLSNPGFEDWSSGAPDNWTLSSNSNETVAQEDQTTDPANYMVLEGNSSARVFAPASTTVTLSQTVTPTIAAERVDFQLGVWVYCIEVNAITLSGNNGLTGGVTHSGQGWEFLRVLQETSETQTTMALYVGTLSTFGSDVVFYVDEAIMVAGQQDVLDYGWEPLLNWTWRPPAGSTNTRGILEFPYNLPAQHTLRMNGLDVLAIANNNTAAANDSEIDDWQIQIVADKTYAYLLREDARQQRDRRERAALLEEASLVDTLVDIALAESPLQVETTSLQIPDWSPLRSSVFSRRRRRF